MKPLHFLPPVAALLGSGLFLVPQNQEASALRTEVTHLRSALQKAATLPPPPTAEAGGSKTTAGAKPEGAENGTDAKPGKVTAKDLAEIAKSMNSRTMPDMRAMLKLQTALTEMSTEELTALIRETEAAGLSDREQGSLKMMLIGGISQKDPKAAVMIAAELDAGKGGPQDQSRWGMRTAFQGWADKDPAAAAAWYDAQIADGKYENKSLDEVNERRLDFEQGLFTALFKNDQAAARARLEALTPEERKRVMGGGWGLPKEGESQEAFAALTREIIDEKDRPEVIANYGGQIAGEGKLEDVSAFLDKIEATPAERETSVQRAVTNRLMQGEGKITLENSAEWRSWVAQNAPENTAEVLGKTFGQLMNSNRLTLEEFTALAPQISPEGGRDAVVAAFLEDSYWRGDAADTLKLAKTIGDADLRAAAMARLKGRGVKIDDEPTPAPAATPAASPEK